jgi:succinoglycan biosynthesis protein ExoA
VIERPFVSIVVASRNEVRSIDRCLTALRRQSYPADRLEIIVADGMSEDGTRAIVSRIGKLDPRVTMVDNPERVTPRAWNAGLRAARGEVLGIMSGHAEPDPDYVLRCVGALETLEAWAVGGRIVRTSATDTQRAIALATSSPFGVGDAAHNYAEVAGPAETVFPGMWPRVVLEHVGIFDPELIRNQDDELSYRIREAGGTIWYDPEIVVRYEPRGTFSAVFDQFRQYGMWKVRVYQKHRGAARPRQLVPPVWVATLLAGLLIGLIWRPGLVVTFGALVAYLVVMGLAAWRMPARDVPARSVMAAFAAMHLGYGIGMLQGLVRFSRRWSPPPEGLPARLDDGTARLRPRP